MLAALHVSMRKEISLTAGHCVQVCVEHKVSGTSLVAQASPDRVSHYHIE